MTRRGTGRKANTKPRSRTLAAAIRPLRAGAPANGPQLDALREAARSAGVEGKLGRLLKGNAGLGGFLADVAGTSPFLRGLMRDDPQRLIATLSAEPAARLEEICTGVRSAWRDTEESDMMAALRRARSELALLVALADLGNVWDVVATTEALSRFAEAAVSSAAAFLLRREHDSGAIRLADTGDPARGSGWILLGMGKLGAGELNYSSDIDLIVLFDREIAPLAADVEPAKLFVRLTQRLVHLLQERTADGYVFRTDLRLRPDPGSTAVAISTAAALQYYESQGQNWERAALIKARPVGGDIAAGEAFLAALVPYIWRKYLDYAAIADIHSIKRQIHDHRGHGEIAVAGHNIKLGRGGIREIEFFVQTQQLIAGGRNPGLRGRRTLEMLAALEREGWIDAAARDDMTAAYEFLRRIEHRLQMIADEQTHALPDTPEGLERIALLSGFSSADEFAGALLPKLESVRRHYAGLFETAPALSTSTGSLVFTGDADDPDTLEALTRLGYARPAEVTRTIRGWHFGRYPAMRSAAARERLTEITPALLEALAGTDNADAAFAAFDRFLARLPAGVQLFALLHSNPDLLDLLATILGTAPSLAETVIARPHVLDALIEPAFFGRLPDRERLARRLSDSLSEARDYEDALDRARIFGQEQRFLIGARVIAGALVARHAGAAYADLAELLIGEVLNRARAEFERVYGTMPGGELALLALGRLGGREMNAASDLDLILLYDYAPGATSSRGLRSLPSTQYYARLTQRLVAALSAPTAEGKLYEVDFRLRPSGKSGPLATKLDAFATYQARDAWTWEHMALTRARVIAGDPGLRERATREIHAILTRPRDPAAVAADVRTMRATVEEEKGHGGRWDLKLAPGALLDIEFVAQYLQLAFGARRPEILDVETEAVLARAADAGLLPAAERDVLVPALRLYQTLIQVLRLCLPEPLDPEKAPRGLLELLAQAGELPDFATLDAHLRDSEAAVRRSFERILGT
jgi:glutamate-ammonia-ligase adenylyltransferase